MKLHGHKTCVVTFDQPLFMKAREIVAASESGSKLSKIIVRLGGFHLLISLLGSIGYIMADSGLKEVFSTIYAPNSMDKMLNGPRGPTEKLWVQYFHMVSIVKDFTKSERLGNWKDT